MRKKVRSFSAKTVLAVTLIFFSFSMFSDLMPNIFRGYDSQRFFVLGLWSATIVYFLTRWAFLGTIPELIRIYFFPVVFPLLFILLAALPPHPVPHIWVEPLQYALFLTAVVIWASAYKNLGGWDTAKELILGLLFIASLYALMNINIYIFAALDGFSKITDVIPFGFENMRLWSQIATFILPLFALAGVLSQRFSSSLPLSFLMIGAGLWWWIALLTTSRGTIFSVVVATLFVSVMFRKYAFRVIKMLLIQAFLGLFFWILLSLYLPGLWSENDIQRGLSFSDSGRFALWAEAIQMSLVDFPLGMGPMSWVFHQPLTAGYERFGSIGSPHNMYLLWAAEYGWLFLAILIGSTLLTLMRLRSAFPRIRDFSESEQKHLLAGLSLSGAAGITDANFSGVFISPSSLFLAFFVFSQVLGILSCYAAEADGKIEKATSKNSRCPLFIRLSVFILVGLALCFYWFGLIEFFDAMSLDAETFREQERSPFAARFWLHGLFPRSP
ncbi:O-antigen ligase family protein [Marinobacter manganoxydans]|uniref:Pilin glycosylation enzyme n=1 Tax=Marinobacter manganoxydans MnI7-9 TaxID=1094979 RepID=G6YP42_9GAMM|nr:O-antigen ligase family protein [Marinobacter manganoxydans]EHJ06104.1 pilin glycosylation enzyme [Marinobacter manganoxydans MnI7-9]